MPRFAVLDGPTPIAFAHRGAHEQVPENSVRAFDEAHRQGYRFFETDLHVSADGRLFAFHDDLLDRVTDRTGPLSALPAAELARVRIDGTDPIPTFDELLESFPDVRWNIDPKSDGAVISLARALRRHRALGRVNVGAFSDVRLRRLRSLLGPELSSSAGPREVATLVLAARAPGGGRRRSSEPFGCVQIPVRYRNVELVTEALIDAAHARDVQVHVWTVDDAAEMHRLLDLGVDGIITDRPQVLRSVLEARGTWS